MCHHVCLQPLQTRKVSYNFRRRNKISQSPSTVNASPHPESSAHTRTHHPRTNSLRLPLPIPSVLLETPVVGDSPQAATAAWRIQDAPPSESQETQRARKLSGARGGWGKCPWSGNGNAFPPHNFLHLHLLGPVLPFRHLEGGTTVPGHFSSLWNFCLLWGTGSHSLLENVNGAENHVRMFWTEVWTACDQKKGFQGGKQRKEETKGPR